MAVSRFDLDPVLAALARLVGAAELLGDEAGEAAPAGGFEQGAAVAAVRAGRLPGRPVELELLEPLPPALIRLLDDEVPVHEEQVEEHQGRRLLAGEAAGDRVRAGAL